MNVAGVWFDGLSSRRHPATLSCPEAGRLEVVSQEQRLQALFQDVEVSERLGQMPSRVTFPGGGVFETSEHDALQALLGGATSRLDWVHQLERRWTVALVALLALVGLALWSVFYGVPMAADAAARHTPKLVTEAIALGAMKGFEERLFLPSELPEARQAELRQRFELLGQRLGHPLRVVFRKAPEIGANAFALPDGTVVFTDEFIALTDVPEEWDAVLLHEIGHVDQRHILRGIYRSSGLFILASALIGDASSVVGQLSALPAVLVGLAYSREFESEADEYARVHMPQLGLPLVHFANAMARLSAYHCAGEGGDARGAQVLSYLSTHPDSTSRMARFGGSTLKPGELPACRHRSAGPAQNSQSEPAP